jgi:poly-beta-hydroxyalkanoate depolymerase
MIKRGAEVVIRMLANVQQTTIEPLIKATIALILRSTQMSMPSTILCLSGAIDTKRSVMVRENMLAPDDGDGFCEVHVNTMEGFWSQ